MTQIVGNVLDVGLGGLHGSLTIWSGYRPSENALIAPRRRQWDVTNGQLPDTVQVLAGPVTVEIDMGLDAYTSFDAIVPDQPTVTIQDLFLQGYVWRPFVISQVAEDRERAETAADRAESAAGDVDAAIGGAVDHVVQEVEQDRVLAEAARVAADAARDAAALSESAAATSAAVAGTQATLAGERADDAGASRDAAAGSATSAAGSASAASGSASDAASSATAADAARAAAVVARTGAETARSGAEDARDAADSHAGRAEAAANEFDLTATATTGAAGSNATVAVTGDGPAYGLALTVPRGDKGERGERGPQGDQGPQGDTGEQGIQGPKGDKGDTGEQGEQGEQGPKGDKGDTGDRGPQGEQGLQGIQGEQGPRGLQGEKGEQGDTGPKGDRGDDGEVSQAMLDAAVATLVDNAPEALDTLAELADALGGDPNFATTVSAQIGERAKTSDVNAALAGKADAGAESTATWSGVSGKPSTFPPTTGSTASTAKPGDWLPTWGEVSGKPATFPPTIGTTASTAKAGNYQPTWSEVSGKPSTFPAATHTHTKSEVGLGNVDNTSDAAKPVSTATQAALDGKSATGHTHTWTQISDAPAYSKDATGDNLVQRAANGHINVPAGAGAQNVPRRSEVDAAINAKIQLVTNFPTSPVAGVLYLKAE